MGVIDSFGGKFRAFRSLQSWLSVSLFGGSLRWPAALKLRHTKALFDKKELRCAPMRCAFM